MFTEGQILFLTMAILVGGTLILNIIVGAFL